MRRLALSAVAVVVLGALAAPPPARAQTVHYVDNIGSCDGLSPCSGAITEAVNAAGAGDIIEIFPSLYDETVTLEQHPGNVVLRAHVEALRPVITGGIAIVASPNVTVQTVALQQGVTVSRGGSVGFTIERSLVHGSVRFDIVGGCTVRNNTLLDGSVFGDFGGCLIEGNTLVGGGIFASANPDPLIRPSGITIRRNVVRGGGIGLFSRSAGNDTIEDNFVSGGTGISVSLITSGSNNVIQGNTSIENEGCDIGETSMNLVRNTWRNNRFGTKCGTATD